MQLYILLLLLCLGMPAATRGIVYLCVQCVNIQSALCREDKIHASVDA